MNNNAPNEQGNNDVAQLAEAIRARVTQIQRDMLIKRRKHGKAAKKAQQ